MSRFDWPSLMRAGIRGVGLRPEEVWALTPAELHLLLGGGRFRAFGAERIGCADVGLSGQAGRSG